jgi:hypothetical protein
MSCPYPRKPKLLKGLLLSLLLLCLLPATTYLCLFRRICG